MKKEELVLPDMGQVLGGCPHPLENETRRKECPPREAAPGEKELELR